MKTPAIGDPVFFEGLSHSIMDVTGTRVRFVSNLVHETPDGSKPRFETFAQLADLKWSDELGAWYLWGRLLGKGRGGAGADDRAVVAELRDRGILPARSTRRNGQVPAGGEHANLCCTLFRSGVDWRQEVAALRRGDGLSEVAKQAVAAYKVKFQAKLADGYAEPGADDSWAEGTG